MRNKENLNIAACGLYCRACRRFKNGNCPGCAANEKANWCSVRKCCKENNWRSCAECICVSLKECRKFNSFIAKIFGLLFRSDRAGCIRRIRKIGAEKYAEEMQQAGFYNRPVKK